MFSYSFNLSDYNFIKNARDSSFTTALNQKGRFKPGNSSYGFGLGYLRGLSSHVDFSGNVAGTLSNFPALFVKGDSIGQAGFTSQFDAMLHIKAFKNGKVVNPFLSAGIGAGYFGNQKAVYAPVGMGLQFQFTKGSFIFLQAQAKLALTQGIRDAFMFYSIGFAQQAIFKKENKTTTSARVKKEKRSINIVDLDADGDGVPDSKDKCPTEKGTLNGCPDTDGDGIADVEDQCKDVAGVLRYHGCPVPDTDADGVNDENDKCIHEKGPKENFGCAWPDADGDGVADKDDKCPSIKGLAEYKGCPLPVADGAEIIAASKDALTYSINFDFDRSNLLPQSFTVLKNIVEILKADKSLHVSITGHADNLGTNATNVRVSARLKLRQIIL